MTCFFSALFFFLFQGGKLAFMLFIIVFVLTLYLFLGRWSGIRKAHGTRKLQLDTEQQLEAGSTVNVQVSIQIPGFWPIPYVFMKDRLVRQNGKGEQQFETSLVPDWGRRGGMEYKTAPLRRGIYHFETTECSTEDVFGLFEHRGYLEMPYAIKVYPQKAAIREWKQLHQMYKGTHFHSATSRAVRETTQINGVREYNYGDRLSRIHWNATARTGTFKSKEFEKESLPKTVIILDSSREGYYRDDDFELAVSTTASLLDYGTKNGLALGMLTQSFYEPSTNPWNHKQMMEHLVQLEANGDHALYQWVNEHGKVLSPGTFVALITSQKGPAVSRTLSWLKQRQLNPIHIWVQTKEDKDGHLWIDHLHALGIMVYSVRNLQELPYVLGGTKR